MTHDVPPSIPVFRVRATICGGTETGPVRTENQDAIVVAGTVGFASGTRVNWSGEVPANGVLVAVIDGMGGHAGGADAAALVATELARADLDRVGDDWNAWFSELSDRVSRAGGAWRTPDMGATAAILGLTSSGVTMANVGDCRIYRVVTGHLGQLSVDDRTDNPDSGLVTQAIGGSTRLDAHLWRQSFMGGSERYVLCSDGVWSTLDAAVLRELCSAKRPASDIVHGIERSIDARNADDNCSVVVVDLVAAPEREPAAASEAGPSEVFIRTQKEVAR